MPENNQQSKSTSVAIGIALALALVCIGINAYVIMYLYDLSGEQKADLPEVVTVLSDELDTKLSSLLQQMLTLDRSVEELRNLVQADNLTEDEKQEYGTRITILEQSLKELLTKNDDLTAASGRIEDMLSNLHDVVMVNQEEVESSLASVQAKIEPQVTVLNGEVSVTVQRGDSLWALANRFSNSPTSEFIEQIMARNHITDPNKLYVGQRIIIPED